MMDMTMVKELTALQAQWNTAFVVVAVFLVIAIGMFGYHLSEQKKDRDEARRITKVRMNREDEDKRLYIALTKDVTTALSNSTAITHTVVDLISDTREVHIKLDSDIDNVKNDVLEIKKGLEDVKKELANNGVVDKKILNSLDDLKKKVENLGKS